MAAKSEGLQVWTAWPFATAGWSERRVDHVVEICTQLLEVDCWQVSSTGDQLLDRNRLDDLSAVIAQLAYGHLGHGSRCTTRETDPEGASEGRSGQPG